MKYDYRLAASKSSVNKKHRRTVKILSLLLLMIICGVLVFIWYVTRPDDSYKPQGDLRADNFNPFKTFKTPDFTFQTDKSWDYVKDDSGPGKFVYRSSKGNIVMRDMTVYVDSLPKNLLLTYVLPVEANGNSLLPGNVSDHCKTYIKGLKPGENNPVEATVESVRIRCQVDGTSATVGTGQKNGSYQIDLAGKSGENKKYFLLYHDLQYTPNLDTFTNIVRSFHAE